MYVSRIVVEILEPMVENCLTIVEHFEFGINKESWRLCYSFSKFDFLLRSHLMWFWLRWWCVKCSLVGTTWGGM